MCSRGGGIGILKSGLLPPGDNGWLSVIAEVIASFVDMALRQVVQVSPDDRTHANAAP